MSPYQTTLPIKLCSKISDCLSFVDTMLRGWGDTWSLRVLLLLRWLLELLRGWLLELLRGWLLELLLRWLLLLLLLKFSLTE